MSLQETLDKLEILKSFFTEEEFNAHATLLQQSNAPLFWLGVLQKYHEFPIDEYYDNGNRSRGHIFTIGNYLMIQRLGTIFSISKQLNEYHSTPAIPENLVKRDALVLGMQQQFKNLSLLLMNSTTVHDRELLVS